LREARFGEKDAAQIYLARIKLQIRWQRLDGLVELGGETWGARDE